MTNIRLLGLLAVVLIISSCGALSGSSANPVALPTPTPSLTLEPTVTPIPTPKPEPTAKPAMDLHCRSTAVASNLKIDVTGTLSYNKTGIAGAVVYVSFSADSGNNWENFSLVQTQVNGGFETLWMPNATGNYLLCAQWAGNDSLHWINATVNLSLMPDSSGNEFSVMSNSSISGFDYNSRTQIISFNTNGTSSTTRYLQVCIPKTLVSDIQTLEVNIDGKPVAFGSESQDGVWVISCLYTQSEHAFTLQIPFMQVLNPATTPWITIVVIIAVLVVLVAVMVVVRRRRRTAATVAAILKENRPVY